ncbi:hypothetical protein BU17DRAFT_85202 [Hysterangium stoloniferum]|nr:hypothetical protein BU17DRAFT_85202 [Hysterangium stoloniferum]
MNVTELLNPADEMHNIFDATDKDIYQAVMDAKAAMVQEVNGKGNSGDVEAVEPHPTRSEALQAALVLKKYMNQLDDDPFICSLEHYSTAMPVYPYPRAPSEFVDYRHVDRQRRYANFEMTIPNEYHTDDSHTGRPEVVVPTLCTSGRFKEPLEGNVFAHGGSLKCSPRDQTLQHARSMASKSGTMEYDSCSEMVREPEEVSSNMSTLTRRPSIPPTHPTEPESSREHTTLLPRAFKVSASLKAAVASTVFPTPCGERTNVANFVTFITAADPQAVPIKCKLCEQHIARKDSLVQHWIRVHAFADLQVALMYPHEDHSDLVINTTQRRDITRRLVYLSLEGVSGFIKASGEEKARDTEVEVERMRERVAKYLNIAHFTSRNYKLVWLLNQ